MPKVKTFRFKGSKTRCTGKGYEYLHDSTDDIDKVINGFICDNVNTLIDIKVTAVECRWHNNGGYNEIDLIYTIIYE